MTRGDFPVGGSPDAVAKWFGFASEAEMEASHARYAEEMTAAAAAEELAEAETEQPGGESQADAEVYGPQFPSLQDLYFAQDVPDAANQAGCSDALYDRLVLERQQTEAAYLDGHDRYLARALSAEPGAAVGLSPDRWAGLRQAWISGLVDPEAALDEPDPWAAEYDVEPEAGL